LPEWSSNNNNLWFGVSLPNFINDLLRNYSTVFWVNEPISFFFLQPEPIIKSSSRCFRYPVEFKIFFTDVLNEDIVTQEAKCVCVVLSELEKSIFLPAVNDCQFSFCNFLQKLNMWGRMCKGIIKKMIGIAMNSRWAVKECPNKC